MFVASVPWPCSCREVSAISSQPTYDYSEAKYAKPGQKLIAPPIPYKQAVQLGVREALQAKKIYNEHDEMIKLLHNDI